MMNAPYLHLALNHIPVLGSLFGFLILLIGILKRSRDIKNIGLLMFVISALVAIPVLESGEAAPKIVKELPGVTHAYIHTHAGSAKIAFYAVEALGGLSLLGLLLSLRSKGTPNWLVLLCFAVSMPVVGSMLYTANLGGQIRHIEIRADFGKALPNAEEGSETQENHEHQAEQEH
jgi:hypothetical protein